MKFAVITYIEHSAYKGEYFSYEPYMREINIWLSHVDQAIILAPKTNRKPSNSEVAYSKNPEFVEIPSLNFTSFNNILKSLFRIPGIILQLFRVCSKADHIHLRCPGNISLLGCLVQVFFPNKPKTVKYAGNWDPRSKQPVSYKFQKRILSNTFLSRNLKVLAYGTWDNQSENIVPFFTASFSKSEIRPISKDFNKSLNFVFVGSLSKGKQPLFAIKLVEALLTEGIQANLKLFGSGEMKADLEAYINKSEYSEYISIEGFIEKEELKRIYEKSQFLILPSRSEGWPKAVAEAMFFGCVPIATDISCVSWMLDEGRRGIIISTDLQKAKVKVLKFVDQPEMLIIMSKKAQAWSQEYTLERFETEIKGLL